MSRPEASPVICSPPPLSELSALPLAYWFELVVLPLEIGWLDIVFYVIGG
ncbi:MAG: hypothetical protein ACRDPA_19840 [Solirubrobacteraceae bacterium]